VTIEQSLAIVGFVVALVLAIFAAYHTRRRRFRFPIALAVLLFLFIITTVAQSLQGNAISALFLWLSSILGLSLALDVLTWRGKTLNEKLVASSWLVVTSLGGVLTNAYIFLDACKSWNENVFPLSASASSCAHIDCSIGLS